MGHSWNQIAQKGDKSVPHEREFFSLIHNRPLQRTGDHDRTVDLADLSDDQRIAFDSVLELTKQQDLVTLGGYAGTGKTTLIPLLAQALGDSSTTAFCALTGKAANVLSRKLATAGIQGAYVGTIHGLIYAPETDEYGRITHWQRKPNPLFANETRITRIVLDEASMVGSRVLADLEDYHLPILAVGDPGQLKPIEDQSAIAAPDFTLDKIHRQAAGNPIIQLAAHIRQGGKIYDWPESENIRFVKERDIFPLIAESYDKLGLNMGILVYRNAVRKDLNLAPRDSLEPEKGDLVICLRNSAPVFNGMRGLVEEIKPLYQHWYKATIYFPDDGFAIEGILNRHQFGTDRTLSSVYDLRDRNIRYPQIKNLGLLFDFGLAMTVHKAQGSAFEEVFLKPDPSLQRRDPEEYIKWLYTAVTRAEKKLTIIV